MRKFIVLLYLFVSVGILAQTDYYYYKGKKVPLSVDKVCLSIPKVSEKTYEKILENVKVEKKINDELFDIVVIHKSDFEKLISIDKGKEYAKSVLLTSCYKTAEGHEVVLTPYLNVKLKKERDLEILIAYAEKYGLKIAKNSPLMPLWFILSSTQECDKSSIYYANTLWESGEFAASVPDFCSDDLKCSNDPMFNEQWGLNNSNYTGIDISACAAWNYATGKYVKIAFLDTGVDLNHIDLASNISNMSFDTESNSSPSIVYSDHGTHCAGIAAAIKDNGIHIAGVAPEATIISVSNKMEKTTNSRQKRADGIIWAYQNGADVISNSWGTSTYHEAIDEAIQDAFRYGRQGKGCVVVFCSGNNSSNSVGYPANCNDTILVVGSINESGMRSNFSNYGAELDLVAPGEFIFSTIPNNRVALDSGTSMACPHVAGVAALVLELNPELTVTQVNRIINSNAQKISGVNFNTSKTDGSWNNEYGYGLVDAYSSVLNTPSALFIQNETITGTNTITADYIYVGKNVTDRKEQGDVILGPGNITLKAKNIEIKNSTTVPIGTTLTIEN